MNEDFALIEMVQVKAERGMNEAFSVLDGLKEGTISVSLAQEMSNAIGKTKGHMDNILKGEFLKSAIAKQAALHLRQLKEE